jgi:alkylation response protein AidB-like acyl-CoA dehydrogenase
MRSAILGPEHLDFRAMVRTFVEKEITPHYDRWEADGRVDPAVWRAAGRAGLLGIDQPVEYGGGGEEDLRFPAIVTAELAGAGALAVGFPLHNDVIGPTLRRWANAEQKQRWLPPFCAGELVTAIAVTEAGAGSDLAGLTASARRDGDAYVLNGGKCFVSNGLTAGLILVAVRTAPPETPRGGLTLLAVEADTPGLSRIPSGEMIGLRAQDSAELFLDDARVPVGNLLGREGHGLPVLLGNLTRERLSIAVAALAGAEAVHRETLRHARERTVSGRPLGSLQHVRFELAEMATELEVTRSHLDHCLLEAGAGRLDDVAAAGAKWWTTDVQRRVVDRCLQLHGGLGYSRASRVARAYVDTRMAPLYGGANEVMKEIIGHGLGL